MNEQQIAEQVAQRIPSEITDDATKNIIENSDNSIADGGGTLSINDGFLTAQIAESFNLSKKDMFRDDVRRGINDIVEWASIVSGSTDLNSILESVARLENELGITFMKDRFFRIARWISLDKQSRDIRAKKEMISHG